MSAPLQTPKWPTPASPQKSASTGPPFYFSGRHQGIPDLAAGNLPSKLTNQPKAENLVVVPATADCFRDAVSALRSLDGKSGVTLNTYSLPEDSCLRLLIKNFGRMAESFVLDELRSLDFHVQ